MFHSVEEKISYVKALIYIATVDSKIQEEEKNYVDQIARMYGIPEDKVENLWEEVKDVNSVESVLIGIEDRRHKLMLINELVAICHADGQYSSVEKEGIRKIANHLGVEVTKLQEIEELMLNRIALEKETMKVLEM